MFFELPNAYGEPFLSGPDEREVKSREETTCELFRDINSEIFEDAEGTSSNETDVGNFNRLEKQSHINVQNNIPLDVVPSSQLDMVEDWDKEIQDSLAYKLVLETFKERSHSEVYFRNQLQNILYSYPPASQAFTKTANYESAVYASPTPPPGALPVPCPSDVETGQFDDAEEDGCLESI